MVSGRDGNECCLTDVEGKSIGCKTFISNKFSSRLFNEYSVNNFFYITCQTDADGKQSLIVNAWTIVELQIISM